MLPPSEKSGPPPSHDSPQKRDYGAISNNNNNSESFHDLNGNDETELVLKQNLDVDDHGATRRRVFRLYWHEIVTYWLSFGTFGLCVGFLGPTLWDLSCQTETVRPSMAWLFGSQTMFILIGSLVAGLLLKKISAHYVLLFAEICVLITLVTVPTCHAGFTLGIVLAVMGGAMGLIDTTSNVCMISLFGASVGPMLQTLHFFYSIGALAAPLIAEPFLMSFDCTPLIMNATTPVLLKDATLVGISNDDRRNLYSHYQSVKDLELIREHERVHLAFYIMELMQLPMLLSVIILILRGRYGCTDETAHAVHAGGNTGAEKSHMATGTVYGLLILTCLLLFLSDGLQASFSGFIFTFSQLEIPNLSAQIADFISAGFWAGFSVGRFIAIFASMRYSPTTMLLVSNGGILLSTGFMCIGPSNPVILAIGTTAFGASLAAVSPCLILVAEQLISLTPVFTSLLVVAASVGETVYPLFLGNYITRDDPLIFLYSVIISSLVLFACFLLLVVLSCKYHVHTKSCLHKELCPIPSLLEGLVRRWFARQLPPSTVAGS